ncbi:MAG: hypothetical protein ACR2LN_03035 [Candidatus Levyibacteriota bacterium]
MGKKILLTFVGIGASFGGIVLFYLFLISLNDHGNILLLLGMLLLFGLAVYLFIYVTKEKSNNEVMSIYSITKEAAEKNFAAKTKLVNEYEKIDDSRNKLKMLEAAGASASDATNK